MELLIYLIDKIRSVSSAITCSIWNRKLQTETTISLYAPYAFTLHVATLKKEVDTFRIGKLFYSF